MAMDPRAKHVPDTWQAPLAAWRRWLVTAGRSGPTIATRTDHLRRAARAFPAGPWLVTVADLSDWAGQQDWAPETRRSVYASLRCFWRWAVDAGHTSRNPAAQLPRVAPTPPAPRPAPDAVLAAAAAVADRRALLILKAAAELGLRRGEIAQIHARDITEDLLGRSLIVHGKGNRTRTLPLTVDQASALRLACAGGYLLPGRINGHLSPRRVGELATAVLPAGWTLHTLRHRFATRVNQATGDLLAVQQLLGHASVATTQRYVATPDSRLRAAAATAALLAG